MDMFRWCVALCLSCLQLYYTKFRVAVDDNVQRGSHGSDSAALTYVLMLLVF